LESRRKPKGKECHECCKMSRPMIFCHRGERKGKKHTRNYDISPLNLRMSLEFDVGQAGLNCALTRSDSGRNAQEQPSYFPGIKRLGSQRAICGKKNSRAATTTRLIKNG